MFVNRLAERQEIAAALAAPGSVLYRLIGRRRIGKTALLVEAVKAHQGAYLFVPEGDEARLLAELRRQAGDAMGGDALPPEGWEGLLRFLERFEGRPVVFDEFQHVLEASPTAISLFQHHWDSRLRTGRHKWFIAGSSIGMMRRLTGGTTGALFGRLTHDRMLKPFRFADVCLLYPGMPPEEVLQRYAVFGGTPHYHAFSIGQTMERAVHASFLADAAPFRDEPLDLLRFELERPARYHAILDAIGNGQRELEEIRSHLGMERVGDITRYIAYLRDHLGLVVADDTVPPSRRAARYRLDDPFFEFYYRFVLHHRPTLELGGQALVWRRIREGLPGLLGPAAERVVQQLLVARNGRSLLGVPLAFTQLGRWWGPMPGDRSRTQEIDVVALGPQEALVGEVKWQAKPLGEDVWDKLAERTRAVGLPAGLPVRHLVVSRAGFTDACLARAPPGALLLDGATLLRETLAAGPEQALGEAGVGENG